MPVTEALAKTVKPVPGKPPAYARSELIYLFYLLGGLYCLVPCALGPLMPYLRSELHFGYEISGFHFSAMSLGVIFSGSIGERLLKSLGRYVCLWGGLAGVSAGIVLLTTAHPPALTIFSFFIIGTCGSLLGQSIDTVIAEELGENRTAAITELNIVVSICAALAPAAVSIFMRNGCNWRAPLLVLLAIFTAAWLSRKNVAVPAHKPTDRQSLSGALSITFWAYWLVILLGCASEWSIVFWSADFLERSVHLSRPDASFAVSAFFIAMLGSRILGSRLSQTIPVRKLLPAAITVSLIGFAIFWLGQTAAISITGLFIAGLGIANIYPLTFSAALGAAKEQAPLAASRMNIATGASGLFGPLALGCLAERTGINTAYGVVAVLLSLAAIVIFMANKRIHSR